MLAKILLALLVGFIVGYKVAWVKAHVTVAEECEKLGSFYVGQRVFKCHSIQEEQK